MPQVTAIVLNYMRPIDAIECIKSLEVLSYSLLRMLVVDNASPDDSIDKIRAVYPHIEILKSPKNLGYAGGMNFGIRYAMQHSPDYLLLINGDTIVEKDFVKNLIDALEQHPNAAAASGTMYYHNDANRIWYAGGKVLYWRASAISYHDLPGGDGSLAHNTQSVSFISGCALLIRASALERVGLFDERFFMYLEDVELGTRLLAHGYHLLYVPDAKLYHKISDDTLKPLPLYFSARNRLLFLKIATRGIPKFTGYAYFFCVYSLKLFYWRLTEPRLFEAALCGIKDFFVKRFYEGTGLSFADDVTITYKAHSIL